MTDFPHQHTAHCESGVMSTLLKTQGIDFNEAMVFGLASALTFVYIPLIKISGMPLISYRIQPGAIIKNVARRLKGKLVLRKFRKITQGEQALDQALADGKLVGLQTSVFWLPYFPPEMRFHFNAHNLLVYAKQDQEYLISDPVFAEVQRCSGQDLTRARFAKGALAAKGLMYFWQKAPELSQIDLALTIKSAIRKNAKQMLAPLWFVGVRGMLSLAQRIEQLGHAKNSEKYCKLFLGHIVRMQEEIGTGGAGFRYLYAYFLEQAAQICHLPSLQTAAEQLTAIGDQWRQFATLCVKQCRSPQHEQYREIANFLRHIATQERELWQQLSKIQG